MSRLGYFDPDVVAFSVAADWTRFVSISDKIYVCSCHLPSYAVRVDGHREFSRKVNDLKSLGQPDVLFLGQDHKSVHCGLSLCESVILIARSYSRIRKRFL